MKNYLQFILLVGITILVTYFSSETTSSIWYIVLLLLYYRSKNEAFWLAFFFVTSDGFMGFLGLYSTVLKILPGLPGIEIAQLYIVISFIKVLSRRNDHHYFYGRWLFVLLVYSIFLFFLGIGNGLKGELNIYFRIFKLMLPLLLFYTVPRLLNKISDYEELFRYLFLVSILAFVAQLQLLFTGFDPRSYANPKGDPDLISEIEVGRNFRVVYSPNIIIMGLLGALYFLSVKGKIYFNRSYLYIVIVSIFLLAFLSATRGLVISYGLIIICFLVFIRKLNFKNVFAFLLIFVAVVSLAMVSRKVNTQIQFSLDRLFSLNSLVSGDVTANGTLIRLSERGPAVMKVWEKQPVFGQGFSNKFFSNADGHVGNQNILMHAGTVGFVLLFLFILFVMVKMMNRYISVSGFNPFASCYLLFVLFLAGWIIKHSTSSQQFAFYGLPCDVFPQAIFLGLAGLTYSGIINSSQPHV